MFCRSNFAATPDRSTDGDGTISLPRLPRTAPLTRTEDGARGTFSPPARAGGRVGAALRAPENAFFHPRFAFRDLGKPFSHPRFTPGDLEKAFSHPRTTPANPQKVFSGPNEAKNTRSRPFPARVSWHAARKRPFLPRVSVPRPAKGIFHPGSVIRDLEKIMGKPLPRQVLAGFDYDIAAPEISYAKTIPAYKTRETPRSQPAHTPAHAPHRQQPASRQPQRRLRQRFASGRTK